MKATIEISAENLRINLAAIRETAGRDCETLCVLKANAYGHGAALCAPVLVGAGAQWIGVADVDEGTEIRRALGEAGLGHRKTRILVMCGFEAADVPALVEHELTPTVWTPEQVQMLEMAALQAGRQLAIHVEIDTGMARQGVAPGYPLARLLTALGATGSVHMEGLYSHLSSSEVAGSPVTTEQLTRFGLALEQFGQALLLPEFLHLGNSSAVDEASTLPWVREVAQHLGASPLVRTGLALYGYTLRLDGSPEAKHQLRPGLQPVATWKTRILGLRDLKAGDTVGYGASFAAPRAMQVALLPVGYADGFRREASSGLGDGWVMISEEMAPVVGRVSMNLLVVDVSGHKKTPEIGDEAVLLGPGVSAANHSAWCRTIPYEILCGMRGERRLV